MLKVTRFMTENNMGKAEESAASKTAEKEKALWFAMSAPYRNELKVQKQLDGFGIRSFIPMKEDVVERRGRKSKVIVPAVSNLVFVYAMPSTIKTIKPQIPRMQYKTMRSGEKNTIITIPEKEMNDFIAVTSAMAGHVTYYAPEEICLTKGTRVRIIGGGLFDGAEGVLVKMKGHRSRSFVVAIHDLVYATTEVTPDLIEVLD